MNPLKKLRRTIANTLRGLPSVYDFGRQARLRLVGPTSEVGRLLERYSRANRQSFNFLQIGANDGLRNDPLRDFVVRDHWSGVFVEPLPDVFPLLQRNYARLAKKQHLQFLNAAVSSRSDTLPFYTFTDAFLAEKSLEERLHFLRKASFSRQQVRNFAEDDNNIKVLEIPCVGINELLARYLPDGRLSLLALDVEGHELEIIGEVDFETFKIGAVLFETWNLGRSKGEVFGILQRAGYTIDEAEGDALALRRNA